MSSIILHDKCSCVHSLAVCKSKSKRYWNSMRRGEKASKHPNAKRSRLYNYVFRVVFNTNIFHLNTLIPFTMHCECSFFCCCVFCKYKMCVLLGTISKTIAFCNFFFFVATTFSRPGHSWTVMLLHIPAPKHTCCWKGNSTQIHFDVKKYQ